MGPVKLHIIWEKGGTWEAALEPLRGTRLGDQFSIITQAALTHALNGFSKPLTTELGIQPMGALRKLPLESRECVVRKRCPFYKPADCQPLAKKMPFCFEPGGLSGSALLAALVVIQDWREGVYVAVVKEEESNAAC